MGWENVLDTRMNTINLGVFDLHGQDGDDSDSISGGTAGKQSVTIRSSPGTVLKFSTVAGGAAGTRGYLGEQGGDGHWAYYWEDSYHSGASGGSAAVLTLVGHYTWDGLYHTLDTLISVGPGGGGAGGQKDNDNNGNGRGGDGGSSGTSKHSGGGGGGGSIGTGGSGGNFSINGINASSYNIISSNSKAHIHDILWSPHAVDEGNRSDAGEHYAPKMLGSAGGTSITAASHGGRGGNRYYAHSHTGGAGGGGGAGYGGGGGGGGVWQDDGRGDSTGGGGGGGGFYVSETITNSNMQSSDYYKLDFITPVTTTTTATAASITNSYLGISARTSAGNIIVTEPAFVYNINRGNLSYSKSENLGDSTDSFDFFIKSGIHNSDMGAPGRANFKTWTVQFSTSSTFTYGNGTNGSLSFNVGGSGADNSTLSLSETTLIINIGTDTYTGSVTLYYFVNEQIPSQGWNKTSGRHSLTFRLVNTVPTISASSYTATSLLDGTSTFNITVSDIDGDESFSLDNSTYATSGTISKTLTRGRSTYNITTKVLSFFGNGNASSAGDQSIILYAKDTTSSSNQSFTVKLVNPNNIDTNFFYDGLDLSNIFQPISFGSSIASNTGYTTVNGTDLKDIFASAGTKISYNTGIKVSGTDLKDIFAEYNPTL
jgi:hypothetical protein